MSTQALAEHYPRSVTLPEGPTVELRLMTADDREAVMGFARGLPQEDLMFLWVDLTQPAVVDEWIANVEAGYSTTLLAYVWSLLFMS